MSFRLQARHVLLTYSQCPLDKDKVFDHLSLLTNILHILVGQESHQDGHPHLHVYVGFQTKPNIRDQKFFDIEGFHPNIAIRPKKIAIQYVTKQDKNPKGNFEWEQGSKIQQAYKKIMQCKEEGKSSNEIFHQAIAVDNSLIRCATSLSFYIKQLEYKPVGSSARFPMESFSLSVLDEARLAIWSNKVATMQRGDRRACRSLWFLGPSMFGKTSLARSLGNHWYMQNMWNIEKICDNDNYYGVLDDISWDSIKLSYKSILGRQMEVELCDKYKKKQTFLLGYPAIVCTNTLPEFTTDERDWLKENVDFIVINHSVLPSNPVHHFEKINI